MLALIDCNSFYASCEQLFSPKTRNKPVVVLSNNDGCVVARSKQAKELGIPMGAAAFEYRDLFLRHDVITFSANFPLYADLSHRVVETLQTFDYPLEIYSIDESFLEIDDPEIGEEIATKVKQWTGIPVTVGIGETKTQAKVANKWAKKRGLLSHTFSESDLISMDVNDIWGIGKKLARRLKSRGIFTADQLLSTEESLIKQWLCVNGQRIYLELKGISCSAVEDEEQMRHSVLSSRSFRYAIHQIADIVSALANFTATAAAKLRKEALQCQFISLFAYTDRSQHRSASIKLPEPTCDVPALIAIARQLLKGMLQRGDALKRLGIILADLSSTDAKERDLFAVEGTKNHEKLTGVIDQINARYGKRSALYAAQIGSAWKSSPKNLSKRFTTEWSELPLAKIRE